MKTAKKQHHKAGINADKKLDKQREVSDAPSSYPRESASTEIEWEAPEQEYQSKNFLWHWTILILAIIFFSLALWQKNYLFAIFVVIAWFTVVNLAGRFPHFWKFNLRDDGVAISDKEQGGREKIFLWREIASFDIHDGEEYHELILRLQSKINPILKINIPKEKNKEIEEYCLRFIPKKEYEDTLMDNLGKFIGF